MRVPISSLLCVLAVLLYWYLDSSFPDPFPKAPYDPQIKGGLTHQHVIAYRTYYWHIKDAILKGFVVLIGLWIAYRRLQTSNEEQMTNRFAKAVELLANDNASVRLGALYALERIANDSDKDYDAIIETIAAYVRSRAPWPAPLLDKSKEAKSDGDKKADQDTSTTPPPSVPLPDEVNTNKTQAIKVEEDINTALHILGRRKNVEHPKLFLNNTDLSGLCLTSEKRHFSKVNFERAKLCKAILNRGDLSGAQLYLADLHEANLSGADLSGVNLIMTNLSQADLRWAHVVMGSLNFSNLSRADLSWANLNKVKLQHANLNQAYLSEADLSEADLSDANLNDAHLCKADLSDANLNGTHLRKADLNEAKLFRANLRKADLSEAYLIGSKLREAKLGGANLQKAILRFGKLGKANLRKADLSGSDLTKADLSEASLNEVILNEAVLSKADLSKARHLKWKQLEYAKDDPKRYLTGTKLPDYLLETAPEWYNETELMAEEA